ncbi:MAG TPA: DUF2007 domain-containing protein [Chitinophagaceae bacterium]|nr:DUF2007 domain-containing protein [Chitinophagaceae bacterium]
MEWVLLNAYQNYVEAHIAKGVLEENEIPSWLKDENTVTIDPILTNAVGGIKLMVEKENAQKAWEILEGLRNEHRVLLTCPQCGSHNIEFVSTPRKPMNWISAITTFFIGDYAIAVDKVNHCFDCGKEFPAEKTS